jgi:predicted RNA-binding Zn-ribbon protein involved in translation (DUF1610 family)
MRCPRCNLEGCEECAEEVDIGVGLQRFVYGYECPKCGALARCDTCGTITNEHAEWCQEDSLVKQFGPE